MQLHESAENYLETILLLRQRQGVVRSVDIAAEMNFSKPSISNAMKKLRQAGHIVMDRDGSILLTESGEVIAQRIWERHTWLSRFLRHIGVSEQVALADACKIEHDLSEESFRALCRFAQQCQEESPATRADEEGSSS